MASRGNAPRQVEETVTMEELQELDQELTRQRRAFELVGRTQVVVKDRMARLGEKSALEGQIAALHESLQAAQVAHDAKLSQIADEVAKQHKILEELKKDATKSRQLVATADADIKEMHALHNRLEEEAAGLQAQAQEAANMRQAAQKAHEDFMQKQAHHDQEMARMTKEREVLQAEIKGMQDHLGAVLGAMQS